MNSVALGHPRISPDNTRVAGDRNFEVWIYDVERGTPTRLTSGARTAWPFWTRDGKRITYTSEALGFWCPFWRAADGSDQEKPVYKTNLIVNPADWSPDGTELLGYRDTEANNSDVVVINPTTGKLREIAATPASEFYPIFSPEGKWVAYRSDESGRFEIYVRSNGGPDGRWQISTDGGTNVIWKREDEIIYTVGDRIIRVPVQTSPSFSAGTPELLFQTHFLQIDATSDHQRFIATVPRVKNKQDLLNIVTNWFDGVRLRASTPH